MTRYWFHGKTLYTQMKIWKKKHTKQQRIWLECFHEGHLYSMGWKVLAQDLTITAVIPATITPALVSSSSPEMALWPGTVSQENSPSARSWEKRDCHCCGITGSSQHGPFWVLTVFKAFSGNVILGEPPILGPLGRHSRRWQRLPSTPKERDWKKRGLKCFCNFAFKIHVNLARVRS